MAAVIPALLLLLLAAGRAAAVPGCGEGAHRHGTSCFWADTAYAYNITEGAAACARRGMTLASVHSQQEMDVLFGLVDGRTTWIGLNDIEREGDYVWSDGTPVDYLNWFPGEPDGAKPWDCVYMWYDGGWSDQTCYSRYGVACRGPAE